MFGKTQQKIEKAGKKTRQGRSNRTKLSATSARSKQKRYRGQGRSWFSAFLTKLTLLGTLPLRGYK